MSRGGSAEAPIRLSVNTIRGATPDQLGQERCLARIVGFRFDSFEEDQRESRASSSETTYRFAYRIRIGVRWFGFSLGQCQQHKRSHSSPDRL